MVHRAGPPSSLALRGGRASCGCQWAALSSRGAEPGPGHIRWNAGLRAEARANSGRKSCHTSPDRRRGQIRERAARLVPGRGDAGLTYSSISIPPEASAWRWAAGSAWARASRSRRAVYCSRASRAALPAAMRCTAWSARACRASRRADRPPCSCCGTIAAVFAAAGSGMGASDPGSVPDGTRRAAVAR